MADRGDQSFEIEQRLLEQRIARQRLQGRELQPEEACHNCWAPFEPRSPKLFCDSDCSTDYEKRKRK